LKRAVKIFRTPLELAEAFALDLVNHIKEAEKKHVSYTIAFSGGSTPQLFFSVLAEKYGKSVNWNYVQLFWADERCVPPDDSGSNYGMMNRLLLKKIRIPDSNIHRIRGEENPESEAVRYSEEIIRNTRSLNDLPVFDQIILGMGEDGHIASIFPGHQDLLTGEKICDVAVHPVSGQKRITITGKVINNADSITFLITGQSKARIIEQIFKNNAKFPASYIIPRHGKITWLLDEKAGRFLKRQAIC
jgi:6-phosphogluconolactonase